MSQLVYISLVLLAIEVCVGVTIILLDSFSNLWNDIDTPKLDILLYLLVTIVLGLLVLCSNSFTAFPLFPLSCMGVTLLLTLGWGLMIVSMLLHGGKSPLIIITRPIIVIIIIIILLIWNNNGAPKLTDLQFQ